jgi:cation transport ATPase
MLGQLSRLGLGDWEAFLGLPPRAHEIGAPSGGADAAWPVRADPNPAVMALPTVSLGLTLLADPLAVAVNALPIFRRAWTVWNRENRLNVDFLDTLAITASVGQGLMVTGSIITWLVRLGDWIRDLTAAGSKRAASELLEFQAKTAWIVKDGTVVQIPAAKLAAGDMVVVYPGEMIPADGEILQGIAMIDQKTITDEGLPVPRTIGDVVYAATILCEGQMTLRATRVGTETMAGQIARLVDSAPVGDTRMQNHAERFADRLVLPTLGLAVSTAISCNETAAGSPWSAMASTIHRL